jgi:hypothetical protein
VAVTADGLQVTAMQESGMPVPESGPSRSAIRTPDQRLRVFVFVEAAGQRVRGTNRRLPEPGHR